MQDSTKDKQRLESRFVLRRYREGKLNSDKAWKQFVEKEGIHRSLPLHRYFTSAAAVLLLLIGIGSFYMIEKRRPEWVVISTEMEQRKDIYMPDNTLITLAAHSQLRYDNKSYGKKRRAVELTGKAFFEVKADETRPFSVRTNTTETTVLGTAFQLKEENDTTSLFVENGKVSFIGLADMQILTAGMSAFYVKDREKIHLNENNVQSANVSAWKTGQLIFQETPLNQVIHDLSDYYQVNIINTSSISEVLNLTATFTDTPLGEILFIINQTLDTNLSVNPDIK
ncbi:FecR domain-containing protein [Parabacteroides sp. OttesenSCG-928-G21]|nr:FecR domain-containing protein [Parabacteroides sp. OttesenSCG-928-G21]